MKIKTSGAFARVMSNDAAIRRGENVIDARGVFYRRTQDVLVAKSYRKPTDPKGGA